MTTVIVVLVSIWPVLYVSGFLHEAGHALCTRLSGGMCPSFGMGLGRLFLVVPVGRSRVYFGFRKPFQGVAFAIYPQLLPARWCQAVMMAGGIAANALVAVLTLALAVAFWSAAPVLLTFALVNGLMAVMNAIPFRVRVGPMTLRSDGAQILRILLDRNEVEPGDLLRTFRVLGSLWRESGDLLTLRYSTAGVADYWNELGDPGRARVLLEEARSLPVEPPPPLRAFETLVDGSTALAQGDLAAAGARIGEAETEFRQLDHSTGLLLTELVRASLLLRLGDTGAALACYEELATNPLLRWQRTLRSIVRRQIAMCRCELPGGGGAEASLATYEALPRHERTPLKDLQVYKEVARDLSKAGRHEEAAAAYGRALEAVAALDRTLSEPDRERFRTVQTGLVLAARDCFQAAGKEEEAVQLHSFFESTARKEQEADDEKVRRVARSRLWRGLALSVVNTAVTAAALFFVFSIPPLAAGAAPPGRYAPPRPGQPESVVLAALGIFLMGFFTACGVGIGLPAAAAGRWFPKLRPFAANLILTCASIPWLVILLFLATLSMGSYFLGK